jgi:glycosyltransferase involved in cell wall biosynthesis
MRILQVIPSLAPCNGGPSVVLPVIERALTAQGVTVVTVTTDDEGTGQRNLKGNGQARVENGVVRRYFPKQTEFYKVSLPLSRWIYHEVKNFDVVHIHALFSFTSIAAARAARNVGVPYVIRPLGVLNRYGMEQRRANLKKLSFRWLEGPLLRDASAVHFTSAAEQAEGESLGIPLRSVVIPLGLPFNELKPDPAIKELMVLYLSRLDPKKNLEGLLNAWSLLDREFPDWYLLVAGDGSPEYTKHLQEMATNLGLLGRIRWAGRVEALQKEALLQRASLYVLPSFSENFGIAAVEAMGAGVPCLLGEGVAVARAAYGAGACAVTTPDEQTMARHLRVLLADANERTRLGFAAREFAAREYSVEAMGQRLETLYGGIAGDRRRAAS